MPYFPRRAFPAALVCCAALPAPLLHQALAATAGTLFEAAPFVLAVALVPWPLVRWPALLLGCGCGPAAGFAALSLPATALCWVAFGPWVALARFGAAAVLEYRAHGASLRRHVHANGHGLGHGGPLRDADPLEQLASIGIAAFVTALGLVLLASASRTAALPAAFAHAGLPAFVAETAAGLIAGWIAPCTTSAVATAAMLRTAAPLAAAAMLVTAGLVPPVWFVRKAPEHARFDARIGFIVAGAACAVLCLRGGSGFVHPRLVPLLWLALPAVFFAVRRLPRTATRFGAVAPATMAAALVIGSPVPAAPVGRGAIDDLYPGKPVAFTGEIADRADADAFGRALIGTTLVRYAITCCRADATAIELPTTLHVRLPAHTWLAVSGVIASGDAGPYLRTTHWQRVAPPADPFVYR